MESDPITSWLIEGEKVETGTDFIFWAASSNDDGAREKVSFHPRHLLLGRKAMCKS